MINQLKKYSLSTFIAMLLTACGTDPRDVYPKKLIESSCSNNFVQINKQATVSDLYMDRAYINMMIPRINHSVDLRELIELFFNMRLNSLETKNADFGGELVLNTVTYSTKEIIALRYSENVIRISIKPIGSKECGNFESVSRYPGLTIPWLRKLGLQPDSCVAIERIPAVTAPTRINVDRQLIAKQHNGSSTQWRFDTTLVDTSSNPQTTLASMTNHYAFSGGGSDDEWFLCATGNSEFETFRKGFTTSGNEKIRPPEMIWVSPKGNSEILPETSEETLKKMTWIIRPEVAWSINVINPEGTVWIGPGRPSRFATDALYIYSENKLYISPIDLQVSSITGLASTPQGFAIIIAHYGPDMHDYLFQFDKKGGITGISKLTKEQYKSTLTPKAR